MIPTPCLLQRSGPNIGLMFPVRWQNKAGEGEGWNGCSQGVGYLSSCSCLTNLWDWASGQSCGLIFPSSGLERETACKGGGKVLLTFGICWDALRGPLLQAESVSPMHEQKGSEKGRPCCRVCSSSHPTRLCQPVSYQPSHARARASRALHLASDELHMVNEAMEGE